MTFPVVAIMIKNEEESICKTLLPFVIAGYKNFYIYDTGSTDKTVEVVTNFLTEKETTFIVKEEPFINFSDSRNKLIEYVSESFSQEKHFIMPDCEWYIHGAEKLVSESLNFSNDSSCGIYVHSDCKILHTRIFNIGTTCRFCGPVHEYISSGSAMVLPEDVYFVYSPSVAGRGRTVERFKRDLILIQDFLEKNKDEPRYTFYLAQTYVCLGDVENSLVNYVKRYYLETGYKQERYIAALRAGRIFKQLEQTPDAINWFLKAWSCVRTRSEALLELAKIFDYPEIYLKFHYALLACSTVRARDDTLFIEDTEYEKWDQLSIGAYHVGEYVVGLKALLNTIKIQIKNHNICNFRHYFSKMKKSEYEKIMNKKKIINLILYSENEEYYKKMKVILELYLNLSEIEHYFYTFKEDMEEDYIIDKNMIYIKGRESKIPGILDKTIKALEIIKDKTYDYIVRSNISTIINFPVLDICLRQEYDYSGPLYYTGSFQTIEDGITKEFHSKYGKLGFVSGVCIVMTKTCIEFLLSNKEELNSYGVIDDVAIGVLVNKYSAIKTGRYSYDKGLQFVSSTPTDNNYTCYRHRNDNDRDNDLNLMKNSIGLMINSSF